MSGLPDPPTKDRKRPDVAKRKKERLGYTEKVVKCSLAGRLIEKKLLPEIQKWITTVSKVSNKGSLLFNCILLHCLKNNKPLPDLNDQTLYVQCFNIGLGRLNKSIPIVEEVWEIYFKDFVTLEKNKGDTQAYVYSVRHYITNFKNYLTYTFEKRQKAYIAHWCSKNGFTKEQSFAIRCAINKWDCKTDIPETAKEFIKTEQTVLGNSNIKEGISHKWLGANLETVLQYFYHILSYNEQFEELRNFTLAPVTSIRNHFLTIDTTVLYEMMKNIKLIDCSRSDFTELRNEQFESIFRLNGLCSGEFTNLLETDGTSLCVHYKVPKVEKAKEASRNVKTNAKRVIAIDPGRSNIVFGVEKTDEGNKTYRLTRNTYYTSSGMKTCNRKTTKWEKDIEKAEKVFRQQSLKTTNIEIWKLFLKDYSSVYNILWNEKTKKKWSRERFRVYCLKKKTLDTFFQSMNGTEKPIIAYGAAKFNPSGKNELSAPTTHVSKVCSKFYETHFIDEYNTTKVCSCCDTRLCPVVLKDRECRGLRWCCSTKCRTFLNRDLNAALNILRCFTSAPGRPYSLSRNSRTDVKTLETKCLKLFRQGEVKTEG